MEPELIRVWINRFDAARPQIARAALGISLGGSLVVYAIVGSHRIGWPIGNDGLLDAAGAITAIGLAVWIVCRAFRR